MVGAFAGGGRRRPGEGRGGSAAAASRGLKTAPVSGRDTSHHRGGVPILGAERRAGASHLEAPLTGRHGRPARPGSRQYSPQGRWRSATGARARREPPSAAPPPAPRGPSGQLPHPWTSSASLPSPAETPPLAEPLRVGTPPGRAPCPQPASHLRRAPTSRQSVAALRAECSCHPAGASAPPRPAAASRSSPNRDRPSPHLPGGWAARLKVRTVLHAPDNSRRVVSWLQTLPKMCVPTGAGSQARKASRD